MVGPAALRPAVVELEAKFAMKKRRACRVVGLAPSTLYYHSTRPERADIRARLRDLASQRPRWGYRRLHVLLHRHGADWPSRVRALYVGDDRTDEDAFRSLLGIGRSIRVGAADDTATSGADLHLPDPETVLQLLRWLASGAFARPQA